MPGLAELPGVHLALRKPGWGPDSDADEVGRRDYRSVKNWRTKVLSKRFFNLKL